MPEKPPVPGVPESNTEKEMTVEQLKQRIEVCTAEINDLLERNQGKRTFETVLSRKINERAGYIMKRDELLQKGDGKI